MKLVTPHHHFTELVLTHFYKGVANFKLFFLSPFSIKFWCLSCSNAACWNTSIREEGIFRNPVDLNNKVLLLVAHFQLKVVQSIYLGILCMFLVICPGFPHSSTCISNAKGGWICLVFSQHTNLRKIMLWVRNTQRIRDSPGLVSGWESEYAC